MTKARLLTTAMKLAAQPTKYDNKTSQWAAWVKGRWLMDCCRSIKAILWGFCFDKEAPHGGAVYKAGYPDDTTEEMIAHCRNVSEDMSKHAIEPGELLWFRGHVGLYLGNGAVFECAPSLSGCAITDLSYQPWKKHGFIREVDYGDVQPAPASPYPGEELTLKNEPLYASSSRKEAANHLTGKYYVYDGKITRKRIRICKNKDEAGKGAKYILGWIDWR